MKLISALILLTTLFVGLTFGGMSVFGMGDDMHMGDLECVNHCIDTSMIPMVASTALPELFVSLFCVLFIVVQTRTSSVSFAVKVWQRLTEPIRLFLLSKNLATVVLRN